MRLLDCHTHLSVLPLVEDEAVRVVSMDLHEWRPDVSGSSYYSLGLHPWYLTDKSSTEALGQILTESPRVIVALGECGLDKRYVDWRMWGTLQCQFLEEQLLLAIRWGLPVVLHVVGAWGELIAMKRSLEDRVGDLPSMVVHGFRKGRGLADLLLREGFLLSFGSHCNQEAVRLAWSRRALLVETDEARVGLHETYDMLAKLLGVSLTQLLEEVEETSFWQKVLHDSPYDGSSLSSGDKTTVG